MDDPGKLAGDKTEDVVVEGLKSMSDGEEGISEEVDGLTIFVNLRLSLVSN